MVLEVHNDELYFSETSTIGNALVDGSGRGLTSDRRDEEIVVEKAALAVVVNTTITEMALSRLSENIMMPRRKSAHEELECDSRVQVQASTVFY